MKIITVIGARPQIIKAAAISRSIANNYKNDIEEIIVHTGQHYDKNMSEVFFEELGIPKPNYNLKVGSGSHAIQTANMLIGLEEVMKKEQADAVVIYGDTNSTLAAALSASKLHLPIVHIEAGLRSFNKNMPEEINRILSDQVSTLLFTPTLKAVENLKAEGFDLNNKAPYTIDNPKVYHCGDIMYDNALHFSKVSSEKSTILNELNIPSDYILTTIHRENNTVEPQRLEAIFQALYELSEEDNIAIVLPLHPRTRKMMEVNLSIELKDKINESNLLRVIPPVSFLDIIALEKNAKLIITDSGGLQKEAFFFKKPCLILRPETEWVELVKNGNAIICDADKRKILEGYAYYKSKEDLTYPPLFGDGKAADFICSEMLKELV